MERGWSPSWRSSSGELDSRGFTRLRPRFYLSTEWGVPFGTVAMAIPFYLARPELIEIHARRVGHVEGMGKADILKYLRHEMGHVVNYGYRLFESDEWIALFGSIDEPYPEDGYQPKPFSRRFVQHLPGWYAQKHPDEDWAETFAVWMTPGLDWRDEYKGWSDALAKLEYCDRTVPALLERDPLVTTIELDEDVADLGISLAELYQRLGEGETTYPAGLDRALWAIVDQRVGREADAAATEVQGDAAELIRGLEQWLMDNVYRWTGHFPERTRVLLRHLADRASALGLTYPAAAQPAVTVALTTVVTALAVNYVTRGAYQP